MWVARAAQLVSANRRVKLLPGVGMIQAARWRRCGKIASSMPAGEHVVTIDVPLREEVLDEFVRVTGYTPRTHRVAALPSRFCDVVITEKIAL